MWAADMDQDKNITTTDYSAWYNSHFATAAGYLAFDLDFDGTVDSDDYSLWLQNARQGARSTLP
jgi:hypothetical protein